MSLKDPVALADAIETLYRDAGLIDSGIFATARHWRNLLEQPHEGRLALIGLYKLRGSRDVRTMGEKDIVHIDHEHEVVADKLGAKYGTKHAYFGISMGLWVGSDDVEWDFFSITEFPNRDALVAFAMEPEWIRICQNRIRTLEKHRSYAVRLPTDGPYLH